MNATPIISAPNAYSNLRFISGGEIEQLWRAKDDAGDVALRLVRFPDRLTPIADPAPIFGRVGSLIEGLQLSSFARHRASGAAGGGCYIVEAWAGDKSLAEVGPMPWDSLTQLLRPIVADIATLHGARKWHGGIRPSRIRVAGARATLVGLAWSSVLTSFVSDLFTACEPAARRSIFAPELLDKGPVAAGPSLDVYALAKTLSLLAVGGRIPEQAKSLIDRTVTAPPQERPRLAELSAILT